MNIKNKTYDIISLNDINFELDNTEIQLDDDLIEDITNEAINKKENYNENNYRKEKLKDIYEWRPLDEKWKNKLLSENFMMYDFLYNENACYIENVLKNAGIKNIKSIKSKICKYISEISFDKFSNIIDNYSYCEEKNQNIGINLNYIKTKSQFIKQIKNRNMILQNDNTTLYLISNILNIDFLVLTKDYIIYDLSDQEEKKDNLIIIYKEQSSNGDITKLIGIKNMKNKK